MTETTTFQRAESARAKLADLEQELAELLDESARADSAFRQDPTAATHAGKGIAAQKVENARAALGLAKAQSAELFALEEKEKLQARFALRKPVGMPTALAHTKEAIAKFKIDLPAAVKADADQVRDHNERVAECNALAGRLGLEERFDAVDFANVVELANKHTDPFGTATPTGTHRVELRGGFVNFKMTAPR
jgi:hypothetical protein